jgi:hypothetical protein
VCGRALRTPSVPQRTVNQRRVALDARRTVVLLAGVVWALGFNEYITQIEQFYITHDNLLVLVGDFYGQRPSRWSSRICDGSMQVSRQFDETAAL